MAGGIEEASLAACILSALFVLGPVVSLLVESAEFIILLVQVGEMIEDSLRSGRAAG
jgi:cation transport ATPase